MSLLNQPVREDRDGEPWDEAVETVRRDAGVMSDPSGTVSR
jgi:hypothetical protein